MFKQLIAGATFLVLMGCGVTQPLANQNDQKEVSVLVRVNVPDTIPSEEIRIDPYDSFEARQRAIAKNNPGVEPPPWAPMAEREKWAEKAFAGIDEIQDQLSGGRKSVLVKINDNGTALVNLKPGKWWVFASLNGKSKWWLWSDVSFDINQDKATIVLDDKNGSGVDVKSEKDSD